MHYIEMYLNMHYIQISLNRIEDISDIFKDISIWCTFRDNYKYLKISLNI